MSYIRLREGKLMTDKVMNPKPNYQHNSCAEVFFSRKTVQISNGKPIHHNSHIDRSQDYHKYHNISFVQYKQIGHRLKILVQ